MDQASNSGFQRSQAANNTERLLRNISEVARTDTKVSGLLASSDIRFHINTVISRLLLSVADAVGNEKMSTGRANDWVKLASELVSALPNDATAVNGYTGEEVNPFRGVRAALPSKALRSYDSKQITTIVKNMYDLEACAVGHSYSLRQNYGNVVELMQLYGLVKDIDASTFARSIGWATKLEQEEELDNLINSEVAADAMGLARTTDMRNAFLSSFTQTPGMIDAHVLRLNGVGGCLCEFPILPVDGDVVVIQPKEHTGTSITNLSESIYGTIKYALPSARVFYVYEDDLDQGNNDVGEIVMSRSGVGWLAHDRPDIIDAVNVRLGGPDIT